MSFMACSSPNSPSLNTRIWAVKKNSFFVMPAGVFTRGCEIDGSRITHVSSTSNGSSLAIEVKNEFSRVSKIPAGKLKCKIVLQSDAFKCQIQCSDHLRSLINASIFTGEINLKGETKGHLWTPETSTLCECFKRNEMLGKMLERIEAKEVKHNKPAYQGVPPVPERVATQGETKKQVNEASNAENESLRALVENQVKTIKEHEQKLKEHDDAFESIFKFIKNVQRLPEDERENFLKYTETRRRVSAQFFQGNAFPGAGCSNWTSSRNEEIHNQSDAEKSGTEDEEDREDLNIARRTFVILSENDEANEQNGDIEVTETQAQSDNHAEAHDHSETSDLSNILAAKEAKNKELRDLVIQLRGKLENKLEIKQKNRDLSAKVRELEGELQAKTADVETKEAAIIELQQILVEKDGVIQEKEAEIQNKGETIAELEDSIETKAGEILEKTLVIAQKDTIIQHKENQLIEREEAIKSLKKYNMEIAQKFMADLTARNT